MDTTFLLATCYYRSGRLQQAKHLLSKEKFSVLNHPPCTLLYAQCCLDLKEYVLGGGRGNGRGQHFVAFYIPLLVTHKECSL